MMKPILAMLAGGLALAPAGAAAPAAAGAALFAANCAACHQTTGKGIPGAFPALAHDPFVTGSPDPVIKTVLNGRGGMPSFRDGLDDTAIAGVISYVRTSWGNKGKPISPALVTKNRVGKAAAADRPIPAH